MNICVVVSGMDFPDLVGRQLLVFLMDMLVGMLMFRCLWYENSWFYFPEN